MVVEGFTVQALLAGIAGGMLGAAIGGLPALSLAGLAVVVGEAGDVAVRAVGEQTLANPSAFGATRITELVGLGPALGPHVAFAGGVAAAAYAGRRGGLGEETGYHPAKDVSTPLGSSPDVLAVGGIFGLLGVLLARLSVSLSLPVEPVALAVVVSALGHRLAFGYPLLGRPEGGLLDVTPYERGRRRARGGPDGDRLVVEPWLPHHYEWPNVLALGAGVGVVSGYVAFATGSVYLVFGLAAASLLFLSLGTERLPVTHHMALPAGVVAVGLADPGVAVVAAGVFGVLGAGFGELSQRAFYAHADTHFDPSFASILLTSLVLALLATGGVIDPAAVPYPVP